MKAEKRVYDAVEFLAMLQENSRFRKYVVDISSREELDWVLDKYGFVFDVYQLIQAGAELLEEESEASQERSWSWSDKCLLELL